MDPARDDDEAGTGKYIFILYKYTLTCQIVVAPQINIALGTFSRINKSSPPNKRSPGKTKEDP